MREVWIALLLLLSAAGVRAADFDYRLEPVRVAQGTWVFVGRNEDFSFSNGGNILNTGFVVTPAGVVVIDTGPSKRYGEQMRAAIRRITDRPVVRVFNTHHHPDHFLGNQGYDDVGVAALPETIAGIAREGNALAENMYRLNGDWMKDTEAVTPRQRVTPGDETIGGHVFSLVSLGGHTAGDLVLFDRTTGVLFTGDLVFHGRAATTPHADIARWLGALETLERLPFKVMVPGHGAVVSDARAIAQTRDYLLWLQDTLKAAADRGLDMNEAMALPIPERFRGIALVDREFRRSVTHLYPALEQRAMGGGR